MQATYLQANKLITETIDGEDAVMNLATRLLKENKDPIMPGFELSSDNAFGTLAVAVAPLGWALIHTGQDHVTQHCTFNNKDVAKESLDVRWEEVTSIPRRWFISENQAMDGIRQWMKDGTLLPNLPWSDDCS